jgi:arsenate reductase-like glutaredoxin family protein
LRKAGVEMTEVDTKKGIDAETVKSIVAGAGGVKAVLNTRHAIAKEKGWVDAPPDADTFAKAVVKEVNLLRRPILQVGKKFIVGFDKAAYGKLK